MLVLTAVLILCAGDPPQIVELWPGTPPGDVGIAAEERWFELKVGGKPATWLTNVSKAALHDYRPPKEKDSGVSMIICPGGGYHNLGWDVEGEEVAAWLNSLGMTATAGACARSGIPARAGPSAASSGCGSWGSSGLSFGQSRRRPLGLPADRGRRRAALGRLHGRARDPLVFRLRFPGRHGFLLRCRRPSIP